MRKWGNRNNLVQALTEYSTLKRVVDESIHKFSKRFNKLYDFIPTHLKPPQALAQMRYAEAFDYDFSILLRERESPSLAEMQNDAVKVEINMIAAKSKKWVRLS